MGVLKIIQSPETLITLGLGSCIGLVLYDAEANIAGMAHIMLPRSPQNKPESDQKRGKFAETATPFLLEALLHSGACRNRIRAKLAGGAKMFNLSSSSKSSFLAIGEQNIKATLSMLEKLSIIVAAQDLGGTRGRSIRFDTTTWTLEIKTLGQGIRQI